MRFRGATPAAAVFALSFLLAAHAHAGDVRGSIRLAKDPKDPGEISPAIVWIEGVTEGVKVPSEKPAMSQKGAKFEPAFMVIVAGQTVAMPNDDNIVHNVFSKSSAKEFDLGFYPKGTSKEVVFPKPGVVDVFCSIHRSMRARILVVPNQHHAEAPIGESFEIAEVPDGDYVLRCWHEDYPLQKRKISVREGSLVKIDFTLIAKK